MYFLITVTAYAGMIVSAFMPEHNLCASLFKLVVYLTYGWFMGKTFTFYTLGK